MAKGILVGTGLALIATFGQPATVQAARPADLRIRVTSASFRVGEEGVFRVSVRNESNIVADDTIEIVSLLSPGLTFSAGSGNGWNCAGSAGQRVTCRKDGLGQADTTELTLQVGVCTDAYPSVQTTFRAIYDADPSLGNNVATRLTAVKPGTCTAPPANTPPRPQLTATPSRTPTASPTPQHAVDLLLSVTSSRMFVVGNRGTYRFRVTNLGNTATSSPIVLVDTLPEGLSFIEAGGDQWSCQEDNAIVTCDRSTPLPAETDTDVTVVVAILSDAFPTITNEASVVYAGDRDTANNTASRPTTVRKPSRRVPRPTVPRPNH